MKVEVCNLRSLNFEKTLLNSIINTGFVVITHHGIDFELIKDTQQSWREFFKKTQAFKNMFVNQIDSNMGYKSFGTETAVGSNIADLKEFFHWKPDQQIPDFACGWTARLFYQLNDVGGQILSVLGDRAGKNYRSECENSNNTILRTLYYPALSDIYRDHTHVEKGAVRAAAHEDINHITLLVAASAPGLQVLDRNGEWHNVPHEENSIVVNIGDMLQLESGGLYKSTTHRVINPTDNDSDRISMPLFIHPHSDTMLAPGITAGQYLAERIEQIYKKK